MGRNPLFAGMSRKEESRFLEEIAVATVNMSERNVGALIVLERETRLDDFLEGGTSLDARVGRELLTSIFFPLSPLHDGATVLREGRIHAAGCFLPLTKRTDIHKSFGTRHRAALGITEDDLEEKSKLIARYTPRRSRKTMLAAAERYAADSGDLRAWGKQVHTNAARVALLFCDDLVAALEVIEQTTRQTLKQDGLAADLVRFWVSNEAVQFRRGQGHASIPA